MTKNTDRNHAVDLATVAALAAVISLGSTFLHEAAGHGAACVIVGGEPKALGAFYFDCDGRTLGVWANRVISAAGNTVNLAVALIAWAALRVTKTCRARLFWWLTATINGFVWAGYFLFSGITGLGDWGAGGVLQGVEAVLSWRIGLSVAGTVLYFAIAYEAARSIVRLVGASKRSARLIGWTAYFTGGGVAVAIGLLNPIGVFIVLASAAASSFGGASGLLWFASMAPRNQDRDELVISRSPAWLVAAVLMVSAYALLLGRSITF